MSACASEAPVFGPDDLLGAIDESAGVESVVVDCIDDARIGETFVVTVDAMFECTDVAQRRSALLAIFGAGADTIDVADLEAAGLPQDADLEEFIDCARLSLEGASSTEIDEIWRQSSSSSTLGEIAVTTSAINCYGIFTSSLAGDTNIRPGALFDAVIAGAGADPDDFAPVEVEQDAVVISFIELPVQLAAVSSPDGTSVISAELRVGDEPTLAEIGAAAALFEVFGFGQVDAAVAIGQSPRRFTEGDFVACLSPEEGGVGIRVLPTSIGCER